MGPTAVVGPRPGQIRSTVAGPRAVSPAAQIGVASGAAPDESPGRRINRPPRWAVQEVLKTTSPNARLRTQRGVTSAEYAVVTAAGCGFATVLIKLLTSDFGQQLLKTLFEMVMKVVGL